MTDLIQKVIAEIEVQFLMEYDLFRHTKDHLEQSLKLSDQAESIIREYACGYHTLDQLVKVYGLPRDIIWKILYGGKES